MRRMAMLVAAAILAVSLAGGPLGAAPRYKVLGTDAAGDAPPGADLTYLEVGRKGRDLEIRFGVAGMLPAIGGWDTTGVEWAFKVKKRAFLAEAYSGATGSGFLLFEIKDGTFEFMGDIEGTYDYEDGFVSLLVPLKTIKATPGTRITGAKIDGAPDVDFHTHLGPVTHYLDTFETDKAYVVPRR